MKKIIFSLLFVLPAAAGSAIGQQNRNARLQGNGGSRFNSEAPSALTPRASEMVEPYRQTLTTISIFARDHRGIGATPPAQPTPNRTVNPETYLVFRGVADQDGKVLAFIEDSRSYRTFTVRVGDSLGAAGSRVTGVSVDQLLFRRRGETASIAVTLGSNLAGREVAPPEPSSDLLTGRSRSGTLNDLNQVLQPMRNRNGGFNGGGNNPNAPGARGGRGRRGGGGNSLGA